MAKRRRCTGCRKRFHRRLQPNGPFSIRRSRDVVVVSGCSRSSISTRGARPESIAAVAREHAVVGPRCSTALGSSSTTRSARDFIPAATSSASRARGLHSERFPSPPRPSDLLATTQTEFAWDDPALPQAIHTRATGTALASAWTGLAVRRPAVAHHSVAPAPATGDRKEFRETCLAT